MTLYYGLTVLNTITLRLLSEISIHLLQFGRHVSNSLEFGTSLKNLVPHASLDVDEEQLNWKL